MKKTLSFLLIGMTALSLSACSKETPSEDPQTVINKAWEKLAEENADYTMGTVDVDGKATLIFGADSGTIDGTAEVQFDTSDTDNPKTAMKIDLTGEGSFEGQTGSFELAGEVRTLDKTTYLFLEKLGLDTGSAETDLMANFVQNFFQSQWISLPSELGLDESGDLLATETIDTEKIAEITKNHNFFEVKEYLGDNRYDLEIDADKLKAFLLALNEEMGGDLPENDLDDLDFVLNQIDYTFQVEVDSNYDVKWVKGDFTAEDPEGTGDATMSFEGTLSDDTSTGKMDLNVTGEEPGSMSMEFTISHDEGSVSIEVPEDANEFDPNSLFGLGDPTLGAGAPGAPGAIPGL